MEQRQAVSSALQVVGHAPINFHKFLMMNSIIGQGAIIVSTGDVVFGQEGVVGGINLKTQRVTFAANDNFVVAVDKMSLTQELSQRDGVHHVVGFLDVPTTGEHLQHNETQKNIAILSSFHDYKFT